MKHQRLNSALVAIIAVMLALVSCQTKEDKRQAAEQNVAEAQEDLKALEAELANQSHEEWLSFKNECEAKIRQNEFDITALREKIKNTSGNDAKYQQKISELEERNNDLRRRLADYKEGDGNKWESFKREFTHDMNELGIALKDLAVDNKR